MNEKIKHILEHPIVGRLVRKLFWIVLRVSELAHKAAAFVYFKHPYVKKLQFLPAEGEVDLYYNYLRRLKSDVANLSFQPKISVLVPVYKVKASYFKEMLLSVAFQIYDNWELCLVDDCSGDPEIKKIVTELSDKFPGQVKFSENTANSHISITSNNCLQMATGDYVALLDHDDRLLPNALAEMVRFINRNHQPDILYSDERTIDGNGDNVNTPFYKPDWSPFTHLSMNYTTHLSVYRTELVRKVGGFRKGYEGSQDHDLMLRMVEGSKKPVIHVPLCLYQWRAHEDSTASGIDAKPYAAIAGEKAVTDACLRRGRPAKVAFEKYTSHYKVLFELPKSKPLVSIIVPTKDYYEYIKNCLTSVFEKTSYENFEVVCVNNGSQDERCSSLFKDLKEKYSSRFILVEDSRDFNFAALNRVGVDAANGQYIVFLNNDTEVRSTHWIEEMLRVAQFPEVGAVGAKLLYENGSIQHAGILGAAKNIAVHAGIKLQENHNLYCQMLNTTHETLAVTAACMMIEKKKYEKVGGFDEVYLPNGYGDADFCLKLVEQGYVNLFNPYAVLMHYESKSRKKSPEIFEKVEMLSRWGKYLVSDPYLNINLQYGEYYKLEPSSKVLDISWDFLDPQLLPIRENARHIALHWSYEVRQMEPGFFKNLKFLKSSHLNWTKRAHVE